MGCLGDFGTPWFACGEEDEMHVCKCVGRRDSSAVVDDDDVGNNLHLQFTIHNSQFTIYNLLVDLYIQFMVS